MKTIMMYAVILYSILGACKSQNENKNKVPTDQTTISKRDLSITKANSYSDIFLDSSAMENFIATNHIADSIAWRMRSFYNARNYQYAWFASDGLTEQARAFFNLYKYVTTYDVDTSLRNKSFQKKISNLMAIDSLTISPSETKYADEELAMTRYFMEYVLHNFEKNYVNRKQIESFIPKKKADVMYVADSLISRKNDEDKVFEDENESYRSLQQQLANYVAIAKKGGWPQINITKKTLKKGTSSPEIVTIKKHLSITGDMPGTDSTQIFDDTLVAGVKSFQTRMGYTADGVINAELVKDMNVPVTKRIEQIIINMDRMRWQITEPEGKLIVVNIPEFKLHVYEGKKEVFNMDVVVGKEGHNTTIFSGNLNQIVFSPYWNVPESIVQQEILPEMETDPNYLEEHNMEETGTEDGVPVIRQKPGPDNSLGRVKFLFPNSYNIYFHDTNAKSLFDRDKRAFSHGCIRLSDPVKMAQYLLKDDPEWTQEKIEDAMNQTEPQTVDLKNPVPVLITYYTAWVDDNGRLNLRDDIYNHDEEMASKMFTNAM